MNNGKKNNIGNDQLTQREEGTNAPPTIGEIHRLDANTQRRQRSTERPTAICASTDASNAFLKCQFLPKLNPIESLQNDKEAAKTERDFYKSLSKVASHYSISPMPTQSFPYPYNITLAMWDMETNLKENVLNWDSLHLAKSNRKTFLAKKQQFDTDNTLYYIPIVPLYKMLKDKKRKCNAHLLLSICSYLYSIADVPYYREEDSFLYYHYEIQKEWVTEDDSYEDVTDCISEIDIAQLVGDCMLQKLRNAFNLIRFEQRLSRLKKRDSFDQECWRIASNAFALYTEYPKTSIFRNTPLNEKYRNADEQVIRMEQYVSFCADFDGWLHENLTECVNSEFNECRYIDEPTIYQAIDGSRIASNTFDFEKRFFDLLNDLSSLLYDYKMI